MQQDGSCEGSYRNNRDGRIYQYLAHYRGGQSVQWSAVVSWGGSPAFSRTGAISHNILCGHSLQELVRAHVVADLQQALDHPELSCAPAPAAATDAGSLGENGGLSDARV